MFVVSYTNISPNFILILDRIQEKELENVLSVICNNVFMMTSQILKFVDSWKTQKF